MPGYQTRKKQYHQFEELLLSPQMVRSAFDVWRTAEDNRFLPGILEQMSGLRSLFSQRAQL